LEVPYVDLGAGYESLKDLIDEVVSGVLASGSYVLGDNKAAFEAEFAEWLGRGWAAEHGAAAAAELGIDGLECVGVGSGTDAIYLTLRALGIGPGDEVVTVSHTAVNSVLAISKAGATPVLIDIEPETFCMDPAQLEAACGPRTRAVMPVHLYGHPVDMDPVMDVADRLGLAVIEDCAQSHGALYHERMTGTIGSVGCYSFYPTKNLGACGDGGAVITADSELAGRVLSLSNCGQGEERYHNIHKGDVSRLDEIQAAILRVKLEVLGEDNERRRRAAAFYREALADIAGRPELRLPVEREWALHVYHLYVVRSSRRDELKTHLAERGVPTLVHYPVPVHLQPAYMSDFPGVSLPHTETTAAEVLSLPFFPEITEAQLSHVAESVRSFFA